ncbi:MAG TPA: hypothetical protein EYN45_01180, partial [Candidatus Marinimicrobia bacterium]|nr:hypothetical protein [Candidatus Neomarinimicrobiota bacterium]HIO88308.1 hypothetical protein [Candidatus Neomarinimicrobiota bacterium]
MITFCSINEKGNTLMSWLKRIIATAFLLSIILSGQSSDNWTLDVSIELKSISQLRFSPSGHRLAMVVREALIEGDKSEYLNQIWMSRLEDNSLHQFTYGDKSASRPRFSPDGKYLAFISERTEEAQVWVMRTDGGEA